MYNKNTFEILNILKPLCFNIKMINFTKYFGFGIAGLYVLAIKISKTPPGIVGQSISLVFFNEASIIYNNGGNLYLLLKKMLNKLLPQRI